MYTIRDTNIAESFPISWFPILYYQPTNWHLTSVVFVWECVCAVFLLKETTTEATKHTVELGVLCNWPGRH